MVYLRSARLADRDIMFCGYSSVHPSVYLLPTSERGILKVNESILMQIGFMPPAAVLNFEGQTSKVKITRG